MVIGMNVLLWVARLRSKAPGSLTITADTQNFLEEEPARVEENRASNYLSLPPALAEKALIVFAVDSETDIVDTDRITRITLLDGVTPWPSNSLWPNPGEQWIVRYVMDSPPPQLPERHVFVERILLTGNLHLTN
jgi:hypothetical protein